MGGLSEMQRDQRLCCNRTAAGKGQDDNSKHILDQGKFTLMHLTTVDK